MPSGLTSTTPEDLILNVAVLYINGTVVGSTPGGDKFGLSRGGLNFVPGRKDRQVEADGLRAPIAELEYPTDYDSHIKGKFITVGSSLIATLEPGSSSSVAGAITTYTPIPCGTRYAAGAYLVDVQCVWARGNGAFFIAKYATARVMTWDIDAKDKTEGEVTVDIRGYLSLAAAVTSTDTAPYVLLDVAAA